MKEQKCGIYQIRCVRNGQIYIGSSKHIARRWVDHRRDLRRGKSVCVYLQNAWTKHGEQSFKFSVLEECSPEDLETREQWYVDELKPRFNSITDVKRRYGVEMRAKMAAAIRARAALITHCPHGHEYTAENTYKDKNGSRICRTCNALRVAEIYASQSPEEVERRRQRNNDNYYLKRESRVAQYKEYRSTRKAEKQEYDRLHQPLANARRREQRLNETPEQGEERRRKKREAYHRSKQPR